MDSLLNYGGGSSSSSDSENEDKTAHLKPVDPSLSVAKSLAVVAAPDVVPLVSVIDKVFIETVADIVCIFFAS